MNVHHAKIEAKLDTHLQQSLDEHNVQHLALFSQLDANQQQHLVLSEKHQRNISKVQLGQTKISRRQECLVGLADKTDRRTALLQRKLHTANRQSTVNHQNTRDLVTYEFQKLHTALENKTVNARRFSNKVYFRGERPDLLMAYLLPIKEELNTIFSHVLVQSGNRIAAEDLLFIRDQFLRLVGSAAQEDAARYNMSTASSFDQWVFPGKEIGFRSNPNIREENPGHESGDSVVPNSKVHKPQPWKRRCKRKKETLSFETQSGELQLFISGKESIGRRPGRNEYELGLSFINDTESSTTQSYITIDIRFVRSYLHQMNPQISTHLNVFTLIPDTSLGLLVDLFKNKAIIEDFDHAIRRGLISPFHSQGWNGSSLLLVCGDLFV